VKRLIVSLSFLLLITSTAALALNPAKVASTSTTFTSNNSFTFTTQPDYRMGELIANFSWIPRPTPTQDLNLTVQNGELIDDTVTVSKEEAEDFKTTIQADIKVRRDEPRIKERVPFPLTDNAKEDVRQHEEYLQENQLIRITPEIRSLTADLAENKTDLRRVVDHVAEWTATNIEYNLSTTNAEASLPSDQVLKQRNGVCDEITNLFIAQMRSLGIPARYVSGVAYTDSELFDSTWGAHGWAEVYFPGHGWVPYDPTYKQFGYVDGTHIVFAKGTGGEKYGTQYQWRANGVDVSYTRDWDVQLKNHQSQLQSDVDFSLNPADHTIGYGQANRVDMTIINNEDHYQTVAARLYPTEKITYRESRVKTVTLAPQEERNVSWYLTISDDFKDGYQYTLPITGNIDGAEEQTSFAALDGADTTITLPRSTSSPEYTCQTTKDQYFEGDTVQITCQTSKPTTLCINNTCSDKTTNPSLTTTAPGQSTTQKIRLAAYKANPYITIPVKAQATLHGANVTFNTVGKTVAVNTNISNRYAINQITLRLNSSQTTWTKTLNAKQSLQRFTAPLNVGYTPNITASITLQGGKTDRPTNVDVTVNDERSWFQRVIQAVNAWLS
jgi:transglutaminase-like putative cysteine protease